jgi:hypothetical protein
VPTCLTSPLTKGGLRGVLHLSPGSNQARNGERQGARVGYFPPNEGGIEGGSASFPRFEPSPNRGQARGKGRLTSPLMKGGLRGVLHPSPGS